jgi:hypothetical protein
MLPGTSRKWSKSRKMLRKTRRKASRTFLMTKQEKALKAKKKKNSKKEVRKTVSFINQFICLTYFIF